MLDIWREALGRSDIGVADDFFDLGGDSLSAIRVIARIRDTWGASVRAMDFFESPTVATLAAAVAAAAPAGQAKVTRRPSTPSRSSRTTSSGSGWRTSCCRAPRTTCTGGSA